MSSGTSIPATKNSLPASAGSDLPKLTEARTLSDMCSASHVDASDVLLILNDDYDEEFPIGADDPVERYPDGEFDEDDGEGCSD